jgi:hypothetical protein
VCTNLCTIKLVSVHFDFFVVQARLTVDSFIPDNFLALLDRDRTVVSCRTFQQCRLWMRWSRMRLLAMFLLKSIQRGAFRKEVTRGRVNRRAVTIAFRLISQEDRKVLMNRCTAANP